MVDSKNNALAGFGEDVVAELLENERWRKMGFYETAEHTFNTNRDEELWAACLAHHQQNHSKAQSRYVHLVARQQDESARKKERALEMIAAKAKADKASWDARQEQRIHAAKKKYALIKPSVFAAVLYLIGFFTLAQFITVGGWMKWGLITVLAIPYALVGFVLGGKVRSVLIPEYTAVTYKTLDVRVILSFIYIVLMTYLAL